MEISSSKLALFIILTALAIGIVGYAIADPSPSDQLNPLKGLIGVGAVLSMMGSRGR